MPPEIAPAAGEPAAAPAATVAATSLLSEVPVAEPVAGVAAPAEGTPEAKAAAEKAEADKAALDKATSDAAEKTRREALTPEQRAAEDKAADKDKPIEYKDFELPENTTLTKESMTEFKALAASKKLSQEDAQEFLNLGLKSAKEQAEAPYKLWKTTQETWRKQVQDDPTIGGTKLAETTKVASKFIDSLPNAKEVREALDFTGAGNHPAVVRAFYQAGLLIAEGSPLRAGKPAGAKASPATTLYPNNSGEKQ